MVGKERGGKTLAATHSTFILTYWVHGYRSREQGIARLRVKH